MKQAFILAAGLGTRLAPLTNNRPKALVSLRGKPLLWHVTERLIDAGFTHITINVHHFAQQIVDYVACPPYADLIARNNIHLSISDETAQLLDTGGALKHAAHLSAGAPVLIHNVDILSNADLSALYSSVISPDYASPSALLLVSQRKTTRYLLFDDDLRLVGWTNVQTGELKSPYPDLDPAKCQQLAFSGIHVITDKVMAMMDAWPDVFSITDFYIQSCNRLDIRGYLQPDLHITDIGKIDVLNALITDAE